MKKGKEDVAGLSGEKAISLADSGRAREGIGPNKQKGGREGGGSQGH